MRALLVDDNRIDRQLISRLLESTDLPLEITEAQDAMAALDVLSKETFDCLLIDQRMPGVVGTELIRALREMENEGPRTPIVVMSGEGAEVLTVEEAVGAGGDFFMAKQDMTAGRLKAVLNCLGGAR